MRKYEHERMQKIITSILTWKILEQEMDEFFLENYSNDLDLDIQNVSFAETAEAPSDLILPLLRYQKEWLAWSLKQETIFKRGILAYEMGMGKTVEAIALVLAQRELKKATSGSSILPSSPSTSQELPTIKGSLVVYHVIGETRWFRKIERCTTKGSNKTLVYHGTNREKCMYKLEEYDFVFTTYSAIQAYYWPKKSKQNNKNSKWSDDGSIENSAWAHYIKTVDNKPTKAVLALKSSYKWALTGTPLQNHIGELYSFVRFLRVIPYAYYFCKKFGVKTELVRFSLLRNRARAFGERTQEKGEEEKQDSPRTINFGCGFAKELTPQVEEPKSNSDYDTMAEIDNYEDSSAQTIDDVESSKEKTDSGDEESSRDSRDTGDEDDDPILANLCKRNLWFGYMKLFLILVSMQRSPWILLYPFSVYLDGTRQKTIILSKIVHPYLIPIVHETKQNYMATLKLYTDEVKDTIIDALKANLKGVTVLTSAVENEEDEILGENNSNQPCENSVSSGQKNKDAVNEDYTAPTVDKDSATIDVDEILPLAIVGEYLVAVDEYFTEEVNEVVEEMKEGEKGQEEEKMEEKEEEKMEEKKQGEEKMEEKEKK
uniref:DEXH helicase-like repair protein n=1 Tax=Solanum tuberosum TaxID=4113 RepID=M1APQ1_SOLTU